ncbi:hypothetical protein DFS34DRAFT_615126 [Phlyctochytrium arcticum]|nr:hypothetical protein DFS34DRAFT_615126 [Phlyctochytrium arcticum]
MLQNNQSQQGQLEQQVASNSVAPLEMSQRLQPQPSLDPVLPISRPSSPFTMGSPSSMGSLSPTKVSPSRPSTSGTAAQTMAANSQSRPSTSSASLRVQPARTSTHSFHSLSRPTLPRLTSSASRVTVRSLQNPNGSKESPTLTSMQTGQTIRNRGFSFSQCDGAAEIITAYAESPVRSPLHRGYQSEMGLARNDSATRVKTAPSRINAMGSVRDAPWSSMTQISTRKNRSG